MDVEGSRVERTKSTMDVRTSFENFFTDSRVFRSPSRSPDASRSRRLHLTNTVTFLATNAAGIAFLEANKAKPGVVSLPTGLQYKVLVEGAGLKHPTVDSPCECHYEGALPPPARLARRAASHTPFARRAGGCGAPAAGTRTDRN